MEQRFKLQAHEVWREGLVREGLYGQSSDFADVLPPGVWNESRFVFGRYNPRESKSSLVGNVLFRLEIGETDENFFVATDANGGLRGTKPLLCKLGEFVLGNEKTGYFPPVRKALQHNGWGRVFYAHDELSFKRTPAPCDWGVFIAANGLGLWKWAGRDGGTWNNASAEGAFRWHPDEDEAARFLARAPSLEVWAHLQDQLEDPHSDIEFARRWLAMEDEARLDEVFEWKNGSRWECAQVVRWLLLTSSELQNAQTIRLRTDLFDDGEEWNEHLSLDGRHRSFPPRLANALSQLRFYFAPRIKAVLPLCAQGGFFDRFTYCSITEPTAHERLEAHQQLQTWAAPRGLSFD